MSGQLSQGQDDKAPEIWAGLLSKDWMEQETELAGTLYVDGHVRLYHGKKTELPRRYVSRQRLCLRGTTDYWVNDALGQPFFSIERPIDHGMLEAIENDAQVHLRRLEASGAKLKTVGLRNHWQIQGVPQERMDDASKRRKQILRRLHDEGQSGPVAAEVVAEVRAARIEAIADRIREVRRDERIDFGADLTSDIQDPVVELRRISAKRIQTRTPDYSLFRRSPLTPLHAAADRAEERIYQATNIRFGSAFNTLLQGLSESLPGEDTYGMATAMSAVGTWELCNLGQPNQGEVTFGLEGRWDYGTTGPTDLGPNSLGSLGFTANPFAAYTPTFLVRNLFWRQGGREKGARYVYRMGRITPDSILATVGGIWYADDSLRSGLGDISPMSRGWSATRDTIACQGRRSTN